MTIKSILFSAALAAATVTMASAKSYDVVFSDPVMAGNLQLQAGQYSLKVEGSNAIFTDQKTYQSFTAPIKKIDNAQKKFDQTMVDTDKNGNVDLLKSIDLAGSTSILEFGE
jgi:hypothetical protein